MLTELRMEKKFNEIIRISSEIDVAKIRSNEAIDISNI